MEDEIDNMVDGETLDLNGDGFEEPAEYVRDFHDPTAVLSRITYQISVASDLDGLYDEIVTIPEIASEKPGGILWVLLTSGFYHRIRFNAVEPGDGFHLRLCECTMYYQGQQS